MTVISVGRYMGIRNPLKTRNRDMRKNVALCKILLVWLFSMLITSPITILGILDNSAIQPDEFTCSINNAYYWIYGSLAAFYIPMVIMVITFLLTVTTFGRHLLKDEECLLKNGNGDIQDNVRQTEDILIAQNPTLTGCVYGQFKGQVNPNDQRFAGRCYRGL
ncbi:5-hydroxytryptamine receptor 2C [Nymphon striatum]|nr:5-hydroxytryptamine receptor 2C [Nymphon striatum]